MIASILATVFLGTASPNISTSVELVPTDDIWVYPHASDPQSDPFLRVWGSEGLAVPKDINDRDSFSFSYLKFDLSKLSPGKLVGAVLRLTHSTGAGYKSEDAKKNPVEVRSVLGDFQEKGWIYDLGAKILPPAGKDEFFGSAHTNEVLAEKEYVLEVDLLKGKSSFASFLAESQKQGSLKLALSSTMSPGELGRSAIYKFYSKDTKEAESKKPRLILTFETNSQVQPFYPIR